MEFLVCTKEWCKGEEGEGEREGGEGEREKRTFCIRMLTIDGNPWIIDVDKYIIMLYEQ